MDNVERQLLQQLHHLEQMRSYLKELASNDPEEVLRLHRMLREMANEHDDPNVQLAASLAMAFVLWGLHERRLERESD
jgi:hypothetical protein